MSYKYNPHTGKLDKVGGSTSSADVASTIITRIAGDPISALKMVIVNLDNSVSLADSALSFEDSKTIGMAITGGAIGTEIRITTFGLVEDASFAFSANDQLYLDSSGNIKTAFPSLPGDAYSVFIGQSLGLGQIFINIQEPISL